MHLVSHFETLSSAKALTRPSKELLDEITATYRKICTRYEELYNLCSEIRRLDTDEASNEWITETLLPLEEKWKKAGTRNTDTYHGTVYTMEQAR